MTLTHDICLNSASIVNQGTTLDDLIRKYSGDIMWRYKLGTTNSVTHKSLEMKRKVTTLLCPQHQHLRQFESGVWINYYNSLIVLVHRPRV